jgi:hypothetical protein
MKTTCNHEPNFTQAGICSRDDEWCDVGVECRHCGEHGFVIATVDGIVWNDDD